MSKIKDIMVTSARYLGLNGLDGKILSGETLAGEDATLYSDLLRCVNLVVGDLAINAVPLKNRKQVPSVGGTILFKNVDSRLCDVKGLYDEAGNKLAYTLYHDRLLCKRSGVFEIEYTYLPENLEASDDVPFAAFMADNLLCYGVACEFCLIYDRGAEAVRWEELFSKELDKIENRKPPAGTSLPRRYWL